MFSQLKIFEGEVTHCWDKVFADMTFFFSSSPLSYLLSHFGKDACLVTGIYLIVTCWSQTRESSGWVEGGGGRLSEIQLFMVPGAIAENFMRNFYMCMLPTNPKSFTL